ncbi:MAG: threonine/serine dehydratase [Kiloniellales bacterium]|nr:threonine/serine dehydratase [Kiloniellales bacterium]
MPDQIATANPVTLADIEAAAARIARRVRHTPLIEAAPLKAPACDGRLLLKLENLQVTGSFKARGASNTLLSLSAAEVERGIITASGGNHGLAVAYAGWQAGTRAVIYLSENAHPAKAAKLRDWGAEVVVEGALWDDSNRLALDHAAREGLTYIHPFADPRVIAGQGTAGLEILDQAPETDVLIVAIGGGGLISGVSTAAKGVKPGIRVIGVEPSGAPTLKRSLEAGAAVPLERVETAAATLAPRQSEAINVEIIGRNVDEIVLVSDSAMREAARWLWFELGIAAELSGAAAVAALQGGAVAVPPGATVTALVCGAGTDGLAPDS